MTFGILKIPAFMAFINPPPKRSIQEFHPMAGIAFRELINSLSINSLNIANENSCKGFVLYQNFEKSSFKEIQMHLKFLSEILILDIVKYRYLKSVWNLKF